MNPLNKGYGNTCRKPQVIVQLPHLYQLVDICSHEFYSSTPEGICQLRDFDIGQVPTPHRATWTNILIGIARLRTVLSINYL